METFFEWMDKKETRTYKVKGDPEQLDELEKLFRWIDFCCRAGHSGRINLSVDGDGVANIQFDDLPKSKDDIDDEDISIGY